MRSAQKKIQLHPDGRRTWTVCGSRCVVFPLPEEHGGGFRHSVFTPGVDGGQYVVGHAEALEDAIRDANTLAVRTYHQQRLTR